MAKFAINQRVRVKRGVLHRFNAADVPGREAVIVALVDVPEWAAVRDCQWYEISFVDAPNAKASEGALEPLTPPNIADWASQKVKQVTKPEPVVQVPSNAELVRDPTKEAAK